MLTTFIYRSKSSSLALDEERNKERKKRIESTDGQLLSDGRMRDRDNKKERKWKKSDLKWIRLYLPLKTIAAASNMPLNTTTTERRVERVEDYWRSRTGLGGSLGGVIRCLFALLLPPRVGRCTRETESLCQQLKLDQIDNQQRTLRTAQSVACDYQSTSLVGRINWIECTSPKLNRARDQMMRERPCHLTTTEKGS